MEKNKFDITPGQVIKETATAQQIKPLIDKKDIKKMLEMNAQIVAINCDTLRLLNTPIFIYNSKD